MMKKWLQLLCLVIPLFSFAQEKNELKALFHDLYQKDDAKAMEAYIRIVQWPNTVEVLDAIPLYDYSFHTRLNQSLPRSTESFLTQQVLMNEYFKQHKIKLMPDAQLEAKLQILSGDEISYMQRYELENALADSLTYEEISQAEFYGTLYGSRDGSRLGMSLGRIVDIWYSQNLDNIIKDRDKLQLYLKKAVIFDRLALTGMCHNYMYKFSNISPDDLNNLNILYARTNDDDIRKAILEVDGIRLGVGDKYDNYMKPEFDVFLENLDKFEPDMARRIIISRHDKDQYQRLFSRLRAEESAANLQKLYIVIENHLEMDMTPYIVQSLEKNTVIHHGVISMTTKSGTPQNIHYAVRINDKLVALLERLHFYGFPQADLVQIQSNITSSAFTSNAYFWKKHETASAWQQLWDADSNNYAKWGAKLYRNRLEYLAEQDTLLFWQVNQVFGSKYYHKKDNHQILQLLGKVAPCKSLVWVTYPDKFVTEKNVGFFTQCGFTADDLEMSNEFLFDLPRLASMEFIKQIFADGTVEEKGKLAIKLMSWPDFRKWLEQDKVDKTVIADLKTHLNNYTQSLPEYATEEITQAEVGLLHLQIYDQPLEGKLKILSMTNGEALHLVFSDVLDHVEFDSLGLVFKYLGNISISAEDKQAFLTDDFGIFVPGYSDEMLTDLFTKHGQSKERDFYEHFLDNSGLDYKNNDGDLDFEKIYKILKFDTPEPFISDQQYDRDIHVRSLIRVMEIHFKLVLGDQDNFGDTFNGDPEATRKRASIWMEYLYNRRLVPRKRYEVPSFANID